MQYETIILELLNRIKILEEEGKQLKHRVAALEEAAGLIAPESREKAPRGEETAGASTYTRTTDDMMKACYAYGKKAYLNPSRDIGEAADAVAKETGMNRSSALMYIYAAKSMLMGEIYKRAVSTKGARIFLENILSDYGVNGLEKALHSTREHIKYRQSLGHTVDSLIELCDEYEDKR